MTSFVIPFGHLDVAELAAARQEYVLARHHYRRVCETMSCFDPDAVRRFQHAHDRRTLAFDRYMAALRAR